MPKRLALKQSLDQIFAGIKQLSETFVGRHFTIDGRLVGDIGESLADLDYEIILDQKSRALHDAITNDGRNVQIKATFQDHLTFKRTPELYLGFKLNRDGTYEEIFNGPGQLIFDKYAHRSGIGEKLLRFPIKDLRSISKEIQRSERVPRREG